MSVMDNKENKEKNERSASRNLVEISAIISIAICVIIFFINYFFKFEYIYVLGLVFFLIGYQLSVRIVVGNIVPRFKKYINVDSKWFKSNKFEERMFKKFNVKKWKNKAPVYEPEEFDIKKNNKEQLIINMCNAELVHEFNILFGYVAIVLSLFMGYVWLFIIASFLAGLVDCIFIMIQRYNRPRAVKLLFRVNEKKKEYEVDIN